MRRDCFPRKMIYTEDFTSLFPQVINLTAGVTNKHKKYIEYLIADGEV